MTTSNKVAIKPDDFKGDPPYTEYAGWEKGYSFQRFWGNCHALLGDIGKLLGVQQLCQHYYLQNGTLGSQMTATRIRKLLSETSDRSAE